MKFSVLMAIYYKDNSQYLSEALESIWLRQTMKPSEIVIVRDGPIGNDLESILGCWQSRLEGILKVFSLEKNEGLGVALNYGLSRCSHENIARMDSDDISVPQRFEKQLPWLLGGRVDVVGSSVLEIDPNNPKITSVRYVPLEHKDIKKFSKRRNPMNHPTVMFRKSAIQSVGGYRNVPGFEDYDLWMRLLKQGFVLANIDENLVIMRAGIGQMNRRRGLSYVRREIDFQRHLLDNGFIGYYDFLVNISLRIPPRFVPANFLGVFYRLVRKGEK